VGGARDDRRRVGSGSPYEARYGFSRAIRVRDRVIVSGTGPVWPDGSCDPDPRAQARRCCEIIVAALAELGARPEHVVRTRMFIADPEVAEAVGEVHREHFAAAAPAATMVVARLLDPRWLVEIEAEALVD
jgi:enamine deaminase RidA (YjgF/YER057c/UK114 family)